MKIHYTGQQSGPFGWAVFGANIVREFQKLGCYADDPKDADCIFQPVDSAFMPTARLGRINACLNFFESPLVWHAKENAANFDLVFVGSTWCKKRCEEAGIFNTKVLIQGVDGAIFHPQPPRKPDGTIRIFSGGKFEYRKGQDLVIAAFREFLKSHPTAQLVCSWFNPWPHLFRTMANSKAIKPFAQGASQPEFFTNLLVNNGIPNESFTILPQLSQQDLARVMANTDFGLFPNRCEGGTNLVLMEYLSCGRPAAANCETGHADLNHPGIQVIECDTDGSRWADQSIPEIVEAMSVIEPLRTEPPLKWTWEAAAKTVIAEIDKFF